MAKKTFPPLKHGLPSVKDLTAFLKQFDGEPPLAEVARAFHIRGDDKKELRRLLRDITQPKRERKPMLRDRGLGPVTIVEIIGITEDGELLGKPAEQDPRKAVPHIIVGDPGGARTVAVGERALVKLERRGADKYFGRIIRALPKAETKKILGMVAIVKGGALIAPVTRKDQQSYFVRSEDLDGAEQDDLVEIVTLPAAGKMGDIPAKVVARIGRMDAANAASRIAIHRYEIPTEFSAESIAIAERAEAPVPGERTDLRQIPLVTIDGEDARDFDDAVFAEPDSNPENPGGWHLMIAIADVAHYVRSGSALDSDAFQRGNSVYFPDRVVPMLPEALSNGLCSLKPDEDRYCLAVHLWVDKFGERQRYEFVRGIMRSHARLTYTKSQEIMNALSAKPAGGVELLVWNLYGGYAALKHHIENRGPLDLNLPEHKVRFDELGQVKEVYKVARLDTHRLIEAYMIAANVAAADTITKHRMGAIFRIHDAPDLNKLTTLKEMLKGSNYTFNPGGTIEAGMFNKLLRQAEARGEQATIHTTVLRSQMQAFYGPSNSGHFGLALASYCHFTSPIRRYSDLIVHRALIAIYGWGEDAIDERDLKRLTEIGEHISVTERTAMKAEREAMERYLALYMADKVGGDFAGHVSGVTSVGLFVELEENGAQGFIPRGALGDDFFTYDERKQQLVGRRSGKSFRLGQQVRVLLDAADTLTGSLRFALIEGTSGRRAGGPPPSGKPGAKKKFRGKRR